MNVHPLPFGPRTDQSEAASRQSLVDTLKRLIEGESDLAMFPATLRVAMEERIWEKERIFVSGTVIPPTTFHAFIHAKYPDGIGGTYDLVEKLISDDVKAQALYTEITKRQPGRPAKANDETLYNIQGSEPSAPTGTSAAAGLRRLVKEAAAGNSAAQQALDAVHEGRKSVHAANVECGFRKALDPEVKAVAARDAAEAIVSMSEGDFERLSAVEHLLRKAGAKNVADQIANLVDPAIMDRRHG